MKPDDLFTMLNTLCVATHLHCGHCSIRMQLSIGPLCMTAFVEVHICFGPLLVGICPNSSLTASLCVLPISHHPVMISHSTLFIAICNHLYMVLKYTKKATPSMTIVYVLFHRSQLRVVRCAGCHQLIFVVDGAPYVPLYVVR